MRMFTVVILFVDDGRKVLLVRKNGDCYHGRYNGFGGEIRPDEVYEDYTDNAFRKVKEEAGIELLRLTHLGLLSIPEGNDTSSIAFYAANLTKEEFAQANEAPFDKQHQMCLYNTIDIIRASINDFRFAGEGDLQYFVNRGLKMLGLSAE